LSYREKENCEVAMLFLFWGGGRWGESQENNVTFPIMFAHIGEGKTYISTTIHEERGEKKIIYFSDKSILFKEIV
jgi:hypothetical protein